MKLTDRLNDSIEYNGKLIELQLYFDTVLRSFELWQDDELSDEEKVDVFLEMFVDNIDDIEDMVIHEKVRLVNVIIERFILEQQEMEQQVASKAEGSTANKKLYDMEKDAQFIYASFLYDYGIDLFEQHGKLHWRKFKALFNSLSKDSKFMEVVGIRAADIPKPNKYNQKERQRLIDLKRLYRLEGSETVADIDAKFNHLAAMLRPRKAGEKNG